MACRLGLQEQEEVLRPLQPSALGGLLAGVGERDVLQAERMELVAKMAELRTAAAASASGRGGGGKGAAEGVYVDKDGNARMAFQVASPAAAAALGGSPVRPPSAGGGHISRSRPQSGSPAGPSPSAAGAAAAARASPAAAAAAPSPLGRPTYPYGRPVVDQAVAKISPAAVRARQEQFVKKHAPLQQSRRLPPPPAHMVAAPPVQPSWQPYQTVAPRRPVS